MPLELSIPDIHLLFKRGEINPTMLLDEAYKRIENNSLNSFITLFKEDSYKKALKMEKRIKEGRMDILTGIPVAVKDNICIKEERTTCGSRMLERFISPYSATAVERLQRRGAIIIGKTNMDEFAMGSSTETSLFGFTKNPYNSRYVAGGSSGGSASAVAAFESVSALGSDTGGSIRQPASFCGVYGLKPTYGRVSRYGLVAFASSLDCIGPITHNAIDSAIMLEAIAGFDRRDSTSLQVSVPLYNSLLNKKREIRIGVVRGKLMENLKPEVIDVMERFIDRLFSIGIKTENVNIEGFDICIPIYYIIAMAEASSNLARYDGVRYGYNKSEVRSPKSEVHGSRFKVQGSGARLKELYEETRADGFGREVKRRIMLGTFCLRAGYKDKYYERAVMARQKIRERFENALKGIDAILLPTSPTLPFKAGERIGDPVSMYLSDLCTASVSLAGLPAISIPAGTREGLPVGMQLVGRRLEEETILGIAHRLERETGRRGEGEGVMT